MLRRTFVQQNNLLLHMEHITKRFPGSVALADASIHVERGEVHALIGENGAGKSTLIKVLTGVYHCDEGRILFDGYPRTFQSPQHAQREGISTIYQEINLIPYRSVAENIFLGRERFRWGLLDWRKMHREAEALLERLHLSLDVTKPLNTYTIATQQMVAIARAISFKSKLVIMDEPTSSLSNDEVVTLFTVIRQLKAEGVATIFVSHRLDELYVICDSITILRDGSTVAEQPISTLSKLELVAKMLGKDLGSVQQSGQTSFDTSRHQRGEAVLLKARDLREGASYKMQAWRSIQVRSSVWLACSGLDVARLRVPFLARIALIVAQLLWMVNRFPFVRPRMPFVQASAFARRTARSMALFLISLCGKISPWLPFPLSSGLAL